jgi:hypothetical protein
MRMTRKLYPPLARIRSELFDTPERRPASADFSETEDDPRFAAAASEPLPDFITDLIQRQAAAREAHPPMPPAVGQIRCLAAIPEGRSLDRNVGILLGAHLDGKRWSGWLVAQEVDYASDRDLVIEADDGPVDPVAGMVQTWNPVRVLISGDERILGKLAPLRLAAVMALADAPQAGGGAQPRPGKVYGWDLDNDLVVATGTPLGGADDPRHEYRAIYQQLAEEIVVASEPQAAPKPKEERRGFLHWLHWLFSPHWAPAPVMGALLAVFVAFTALQPADDTERYRSDLPACKDLPRLRVVFNPAAPQADTLLLLRKIEARVVDGPSETGELWLSLPPSTTPAEALAHLKASPLVDQALLINMKDSRCKP